MKPKPTETTALVTSTAVLTIRGQKFEMTVEELQQIHDEIGKALGKNKPQPDLSEIYRKMTEDRDKMRPFYAQPPIQMPINPRTGRPYEVMCRVGGDS